MVYEYHDTHSDGEWTVDGHGTVVVLFAGEASARLSICDRRGRFFRRSGGLRLELTAFNDAFRVDAADQRWASAVLDPRTMDCLLNSARFDKIQVRGDAVVVQHASVLQPQEIEATLKMVYAMSSLFPAAAR